ncbi:TRAP transporter small permease [Pseudogracilibacillus auburnensis]|uniref:TRAP transporter small permease n=1 Tax=Pseudogracilibacillus auburnensis TaxID=1494959 RepID=UPI001A96B532|nr:TRAP transporter small permease [Pseudogracilibacillus auburnensis]MBO1003248.1 TRAP transporter small permease [Pseudogracilibacillus auburnensis]
MGKVMGVVNRIDAVSSIIASITLLIMMVWIFLDVMLRTLFNSPIQGTLEITGEYLMVLLIYLAISYTHKNNGHVKVTMFEDKFTPKVKNIMTIIINLLAAFFFLVISILNFQEGMSYIERGIHSSSILNYPLAPALFIISFGLFIITLRLIIECIYILTNKETIAKEMKSDE